jgi:PPK2 family polyphosphate:nucleotide phosphotransferase
MAKIRPQRIRRLVADLRVEPGRKVRLPRDFDPGTTTRSVSKTEAKAVLEQGIEFLAEYQARLAAQDKYGLLVCLQAMDAAGKDGAIKHVMSGVNPQGVEVHSFKVPSSEDLDHDYLWRYQKRLPERGRIGIFNRSYYEEVLVVRVHPQILDGQKIPTKLKDRGIWKRRYREINDWERYLTDQGYRIVKIFLNVSRDEQRNRLLARIDDPERNWKFSAADVKERRNWDAYQAAFAEMLSNTSTAWAPWYVIPADNKPFARLAAAAVILDALVKIDPHFPTVPPDALAAFADARIELMDGKPPAVYSTNGSDGSRPGGGKGKGKGHARARVGSAPG